MLALHCEVRQVGNCACQLVQRGVQMRRMEVGSSSREEQNAQLAQINPGSSQYKEISKAELEKNIAYGSKKHKKIPGNSKKI